MLDYLETAKKILIEVSANISPETRDQWVQEQTQMAIVYALIAICEQLDSMNKRFEDAIQNGE